MGKKILITLEDYKRYQIAMAVVASIQLANRAVNRVHARRLIVQAVDEAEGIK